jgi:hypothetical protein
VWIRYTEKHFSGEQHSLSVTRSGSRKVSPTWLGSPIFIRFDSQGDDEIADELAEVALVAH